MNLEEYNKEIVITTKERLDMLPGVKPVKFYWMHWPCHKMVMRREMVLPETFSITRHLI